MSRRRAILPACLLAVATFAGWPGAGAQTRAADPEAVYTDACASCHERPETKAPPIESLRRMPLNRILQTLEIGVMRPMAESLQPAQRQQLAKWLAAPPDEKGHQWLQARACARATPVGPTGHENWGMGSDNWRHARDVGIDRGNVAGLELLWSIALPEVTSMRSQPVVAGDTIFLGGQDGRVLALDRETGCVRWHVPVDATVRNALTLERTPDGVATLFLADGEHRVPGHTPQPGVHAVSVADGKVLWSRKFARGCDFDPADKPGLGLLQAGVTRNPWPACPFHHAPSAPPTLANGLVYAATLDGKVHVLDAASGDVLKVLETNRPFKGGNGVDGHGGAIDVSGPLPSGRQLIVTSGYALFGQMPGNMLLVYGLKRGS